MEAAFDRAVRGDRRRRRGVLCVVLLVVTPPSVFGMLVSAQALTVSMFGGVGSVWGAADRCGGADPGSEILHAELGAWIPGIQGVIFGGAIITVILVAPEGVFWKVRDYLRRRRAATQVAPAAAELLEHVIPFVPAQAKAMERPERQPTG